MRESRTDGRSVSVVLVVASQRSTAWISVPYLDRADESSHHGMKGAVRGSCCATLAHGLSERCSSASCTALYSIERRNLSCMYPRGTVIQYLVHLLEWQWHATSNPFLPRWRQFVCLSWCLLSPSRSFLRDRPTAPWIVSCQRSDSTVVHVTSGTHGPRLPYLTLCSPRCFMHAYRWF